MDIPHVLDPCMGRPPPLVAHKASDGNTKVVLPNVGTELAPNSGNEITALKNLALLLHLVGKFTPIPHGLSPCSRLTL